MFEDGEKALETILALVNKCPKDMQAKCFEILLTGYVQGAISRHQETRGPDGAQGRQVDEIPVPSESHVPDSVAPRFAATARRLGVDHSDLTGLFDFARDPFAFHAVVLPGTSTAEKTRNAALAVAARSYLAEGTWVADWQEVKAMCVDQNCYERTNFATNLKAGEGLFKQVESGKPLYLTAKGIKQAEALITALATPN